MPASQFVKAHGPVQLTANNSNLDKLSILREPTRVANSPILSY